MKLRHAEFVEMNKERKDSSKEEDEEEDEVGARTPSIEVRITKYEGKIKVREEKEIRSYV